MLRIVTVILIVVSTALALKAPKLYNKWGLQDCTVGKDCFIAIPRTTAEVTKNGWTAPPETLSNAYLKTFCKDGNGRLCVLLDKKGSIAGYQIGIPAAIAEGKKQPIDYEAKGFKKLSLFNEFYLATRVLFVTQDVIKNGGRNFNGQTGTGVFLQVGKELVKVPETEAAMPGKTLFKKQKCMPRMGQHWFWDISKDQTATSYMPWFALYNKKGELHGFGFSAFGSKGDAKSSSIFEAGSTQGFKTIAPDTPKWVYDNMDENGGYTLHTYFGEEPWNIEC